LCSKEIIRCQKLKVTKSYRETHVKCINVTIFGILTYPVENTMALGGVATGSMNANEHATAAVIIRYKGWDPVFIA
jgi:hypothetical protein